MNSDQIAGLGLAFIAFGLVLPSLTDRLRAWNARAEAEREARDAAKLNAQLAEFDRHCATTPGMRLADNATAARVAALIAANEAQRFDPDLVDWTQTGGAA